MPEQTEQHPQLSVHDDDERVSISDVERRAGMNWITWDGILASLYVALTGGVFLTGFALLVGASEVAIGVLSGLPRLSQLMQPLGAYFVERLHMRKRISVWVFGPARMLWLLVILLPLIGYHGGPSRLAMIVLFVVAIGSALLSGFAACSWLAWMADLIPEPVRGSFFGRRTMLAGAIGAVVCYLAGRYIDAWSEAHGEQDALGFLILFGVAAILGIASWYTLIRCPEPEIEEEPEEEVRPFMHTLVDAWRNANFRQLVYSIAILTFGVWVAGPFFSVYMIENLKLPYSLMNILGAFSSVGSLMMVRFWGALSDHFGNRPVMLTCMLGVAVVPLLWLPCAAGTWWPLIIAHFVGGATWSGIYLAQMNLVFKLTPHYHKAVYIGIFYALTNLPSLFSPILGGYFLEHTEDLSIQIGSWTFINHHLVFLMSGLIRFMAVPLFHRVKEPRAKKVTHMIRVLSHIRTMNPAIGLHYTMVFVGAASSGTRKAAKAVRRTADRLIHWTGEPPEGADT